MSKKASLIIKFILFPIIFYVVCLVVAFFFRDDANAYSRILMHELHNQEKIDVLFCGASHVSHGLLPSVMDEKLGNATFCAGTPSQRIIETYSVIQDAVSFYDIKEIFLEMDSDVAMSTPPMAKVLPMQSAYLATHYLKNPKVKFNHVLETISPSYYLSAMLPIGQGQLIDLDPAVFLRNVKSKFGGEYYKYVYKNEGSEYKDAIDYQGKGCIFVRNAIANGTFSSDEQFPIFVDKISEVYKDYVLKIIEFCKEKNIRLNFYAHPNSDFFNCNFGNYNEYYLYIKNLVESHGVEFYDFNLCKTEFLTLEDLDFCDTNHLNESGIRKFTQTFCIFYKSDDKKNMFHKSYEEKLLEQPSKILGLYTNKTADTKSLTIVPILNHGDVSKISYTVNIKAISGNGLYENTQKKSSDNVIEYPKNSSGEIEIHAYYDGVEHCHITTPFVSM